MKIEFKEPPQIDLKNFKEWLLVKGIRLHIMSHGYGVSDVANKKRVLCEDWETVMIEVSLLLAYQDFSELGLIKEGK